MCDCKDPNCGCCTPPIPIPTGDPGQDGAPGANGTNGTDGIFGGYSGEWSFSASTGSGTAATEIRLNSATYSSVTNIFINDSNIDSIDYSAFLASMSNGGAFGFIRLFKEDDSTVFWLGQVTAVTDNGSEYDIDVTYILHNGTFSASDNVVTSFVGNGATGAAGTNGTDGTDGVVVLANNLTLTSTTSVGFTVLRTYTIPAAQLASDGDRLHIRAIMTKSSPTFPLNAFGVRIDINGTWITASPSNYDFNGFMETFVVDLWLERKTNTSAVVYSTSQVAGPAKTTNPQIMIHENPASLGVLDWTGATHDIELFGRANGSESITVSQFLIEYHKI